MRHGWQRVMAVLGVAMAAVSAAHADRTSASVAWRGVTVFSSEDIWESPQGKLRYVSATQVRYPLTNLFDHDPNTAWVHSDDRLRRGSGTLVTARKTAPYIEIVFAKPTVIDGLQLMNGYEKSDAVYAKNSRVTSVRVSADDTVVKNTALADRRGWHTVSLPERRVRRVKIEFTQVAPGATDDDLCVSELVFTRQGKAIDLRMPKGFVLFSPGSECGCGNEGNLMRPNGSLLTDSTEDIEGIPAVYSSSGRYLAGAKTYDGNKPITPYLWIADVERGTVVKRTALSCPPDRLAGGEIQWQTDNALHVAYQCYTDKDFRKTTNKKQRVVVQ